MEPAGAPIVGVAKIPGSVPVVHLATPSAERPTGSGGRNLPHAPNPLEEIVETIRCRRCQKDAPALDRAPFRNERGERILKEICRNCWDDWLEHQTLLINHFGLDPREPESRQFLYEQIDSVLFEEGEAEDIDTSRQGEIEW